MMRSAAALWLLGLPLGLSLAACGDNHGPADQLDAPPAPDAPDTPDAPTGPACLVPPGELPTEGPLRDPAAFEIAGCVSGGLRDLPGHWFLTTGPGFLFEYPKLAGTCDTGFQRVNGRPDDHDLSDGHTLHTWSDGTRFFTREHYRFAFGPGQTFEYVISKVTCMKSDGTLAGVTALSNSETGETRLPLKGTRFDRRASTSMEMPLLGELGMQHGAPIPAYNVVVQGRYAFTVGPLGLDIIDITTPTAPIHTGHVAGAFNDVRVVRIGGKMVAYAAPLDSDTTAIIDATDPANPVVTGQIPEYSHSLFVAQAGAATHLYLATYTDVVPRYDISNPLAPVRLGEAIVPGASDGVHDLFVDGNRFYVNYTTGGMVALDVSAGLPNAVEVGRNPSTYSHASWVGVAGGRKIILHGDEGMTPEGGAYLRILDGDPASPTYMQQIGRYQSREQVGIHNFMMVGNRAYIAYYQDGVRVVDLSNPTAPQEIAHYDTLNLDTAPGGPFEGALGIRVAGGKVYVADSERGLLIFDELAP